MSPSEIVAFKIAEKAPFPVTMYVPSPPGYVTRYVNPSFEQFSGFASNDLIGASWTELLSGAIDPLAFDNHIAALQNRGFSRACYWGLTSSRDRYYCLMFSELIKIPNSDTLAVACHFDLSSSALASVAVDPTEFDDRSLIEKIEDDGPMANHAEMQRHALQMRAAGLSMAIRNAVMMSRV